MTLNDLIEQLRDLQANHGELEVRLQCDHGQALMKATWCGVSLIEDAKEWLGESLHEEDLDEHPDATKVIEIQAF